MSDGPYRERPKLMLCPRCGEVLDHAFDAVRVCMRCEGVWLAAISLEKAFGDRRWPDAQNTWWRNATPCPECAMEGEASIMNAAMVGPVMIDRCYHHGLWLDRGELGRLMGGELADARGDDDLAALRERLQIVDAELEALLKRREAWRAEAELRSKSAAEYRAWLAEEQESRLVTERLLEEDKRLESPVERASRERRAAEDKARAAERERIEAEQKRLAAEATERAEQAGRAAQRQDDEKARQAERLRNAERLEREQALERFGHQRANASSRVARLEQSLRELRDQVREREAELAKERARLREAEYELMGLEREKSR